MFNIEMNDFTFRWPISFFLYLRSMAIMNNNLSIWLFFVFVGIFCSCFLLFHVNYIFRFFPLPPICISNHEYEYIGSMKGNVFMFQIFVSLIPNNNYLNATIKWMSHMLRIFLPKISISVGHVWHNNLIIIINRRKNKKHF